jgi:hypothetical protein
MMGAFFLPELPAAARLSAAAAWYKKTATRFRCDAAAIRAEAKPTA